MPIIQQGATLREVLKHPSVEECKMVDIGASQTPSFSCPFSSRQTS